MGTLPNAEVVGLTPGKRKVLRKGRFCGSREVAPVLRAGKPALPCGAAQLNLAFEPAGFVTKFRAGFSDLRSAAPECEFRTMGPNFSHPV